MFLPHAELCGDIVHLPLGIRITTSARGGQGMGTRPGEGRSRQRAIMDRRKGVEVSCVCLEVLIPFMFLLWSEIRCLLCACLGLGLGKGKAAYPHVGRRLL